MPSISSFLRFRYSMRALLALMTLFALFLWYHLDWISKRRAAIEADDFNATASFDSFHRPQAPGLLWMFGEQGYQFLTIKGQSSRVEAERLKRLFPEASVDWELDQQVNVLQ